MCAPSGGTLIFSYIHCTIFGVKKLNFNIFLDFQKMNISGGMKILWIFSFFFFFFFFLGGGGGSSQNWTLVRGHFHAF